MTLKPETDHYHLGSIALHWAMLLLFIAVYGSIELRELFDKGSVPRETLKSLHFMLGLLVLGLVWLRIALRLVYPAPAIQPAPRVARRDRHHDRRGAGRPPRVPGRRGSPALPLRRERAGRGAPAHRRGRALGPHPAAHRRQVARAGEYLRQPEHARDRRLL